MVFGALAAAFALIAELLVFSLFTFSENSSVTPLPVSESGLSITILTTLLLGALIEEASKYLFLIRYRVLRLRENAPALKGALLLGLFFGLGFSLPEAWSAWHTIGLEAAPITGIVAIHTITSLLLAASALIPDSRFRPWLAFILAAGVHIAYNITAYLVFPAY